MLCIIPVARAVRHAFPDAEIALVGLPWQTGFVSRFSHYFDRLIEFPGWPGLPEQQVCPEKTQRFLMQMQNEHFDLILQMQGNGEITNSMCALWGGNKVVGLRRAAAYCPDDRLFPVSEDTDHEVLRFLKLTEALNIPRQGEDLEFPLMHSDEEEFRSAVETLGISAGNYICLHPGARDIRRRWPSSHFAFVGDKLAGEGYSIVLTGSEAERGLLTEVAGNMKHNVVNTIDALKQVSLGLLAAIIKHSRLLISNDTGVSHIAAALKVPTIIVFSQYSDIHRWAPLNKTLHRIISPEQSGDPEYTFRSALFQLAESQRKRPTMDSSLSRTTL